MRLVLVLLLLIYKQEELFIQVAIYLMEQCEHHNGASGFSFADLSMVLTHTKEQEPKINVEDRR